MTPPGSMRRIHDYKPNIQDLDEDEKMRNRASLDSNASTILGEDEGAFEDEYLWTDDQIAIILRVCLFLDFPINYALLTCPFLRRWKKAIHPR